MRTFTERLGVPVTGAVRTELACWERCRGGQAWPG
jgi:hypothetical protein